MPSLKSALWVYTLHKSNSKTGETYVGEPPYTDMIMRFHAYGDEVGDAGETPHWQGYIQFRKQVTAGQCKLALKCNWAHVEIMRGNLKHNENYCKKEHKYKKFGEYCPQGHRGDLEQMCADIREGKVTINDVIVQYPMMYHLYSKTLLAQPTPSQALDWTDLRPWQDLLKTKVSGPGDKRRIIWVVDEKGQAGKSDMCTWLIANAKAIELPLREVDGAYLYNGEPIAIFDVARSDIGNVPYNFIEKLKNGRVISTKFVPKVKTFKRPHVIVFANQEPDYNAWSHDRYDLLFTSAIAAPAAPG